jgi:hypothetical protein
MCLDPVPKEHQFYPPAIMAIMIHLLQQAIEPLESKEPPAVDRTKELDHILVVHGQVMAYDQMNPKSETT